MERLQKIADEFKARYGHDMMCTLMFDEMYLRKQVLFSLQYMNYVGYTDYNQPGENGQKKIAKQAIVFLLNGIEVNFEYPVAYHFIDELNMNERKS